MFKNSMKIIIFSSLLLSSCMSTSGMPGGGSGASYTPVIDGPKDDKYYVDIGQCRELAANVEAQANQAALPGAVTGAGIGGLFGAATGSQGDGRNKKIATTTGLAGGLGGASQKVQDAKTVIIRCMQGRGYNVLL